VVAPETLARLTDSAQPRAMWVRTTSGADPLQLVGALRELGHLVSTVLGLLGISVTIAVIGIANTLGSPSSNVPLASVLLARRAAQVTPAAGLSLD
jgi:hypothetical protein